MTKKAYQVENNRLFILCRVAELELTVSLYQLEDKQKPRTKLSMYPVNIHIGELKTAFT